MRAVDLIKLPFARFGWWEHGGRGSHMGQLPSPWTLARTRLHSTASFSSIQNPNKGTELQVDRSLGFLEGQLLPAILWPQKGLWHPGRCCKGKCIENILVFTQANALWGKLAVCLGRAELRWTLPGSTVNTVRP